MHLSNLFEIDDDPDTVSLPAQIGERIAARLADGCHLTRSVISSYFAEATGAADWGSAWSIDDYNDAVEIGALLWLRRHSRITLSTGAHEAASRFEWLEAALPPRHVRSENQVELQQFSTPPMLAWLMARAAALRTDDSVLDPSAGNGTLALWPAAHGCSISLNEIDPGRRASIAHLFPEARISGHDGELIDHLLLHCTPSVILINPPFARSRERGVSGSTAMRHLRSACRLAVRGARIVAIMPESFDAASFVAAEIGLAMRLDAQLSGAFRKSGTGIAVRLVVIDKGAVTGPVRKADLSDLTELDGILTDLFPRTPRLAQVHCLPVRAASRPALPTRASKPVAPFPATAYAQETHESLIYVTLEEPADSTEQAGLYLPYRASRIVIDDAPVHPTPLVESVAMGSVAAPIPRAQPCLPVGWRKKELLSAAQCESLVYACEAFSHNMPGRYRPTQEGTMLEQAEDGLCYRQGFFLGDGTGAGKGRQIAAIIMDRWLVGERRHIWITKNEALLEDARRDWEALGGLPLDIQSLSRWKLGTPIILPQGILFVTYPTLRSGRCDDTRLDQLLAWASAEFDGVIAFDEAHAMANALGGAAVGTGMRGTAKGSEQGMAGLRLQNRLPRARILYASATGASEIANLGYASRLGLWGPETAFPTHESFMTEIRAGGVAAMELVARDLKAQGLYLSRSLSFAGVEYEILEHRLTEAQIRIYDAYAAAWAIIHRNLDDALEATRIVDEDSGDTLNRNAKAAALSMFEGTKQRFFAQLLLSMKLPSLIPAMEEALGSDHSVVVQLVSTAEAMLDRRLADLTPEEREALDIDLSPREYVLSGDPDKTYSLQSAVMRSEGS